MAMSEAASESKRAGAATLGVTLELLSIVTFAGTIWATFKVAELGTQIGISSTNDPASWFVFGAGLFISSVLLGIGYTLTFLCAIYDRQKSRSSGVGGPDRATSGRIPNEAKKYRQSHSLVNSEEAPAPPPPAVKSVSTPQLDTLKSPESGGPEKSSVWEWLTRERHFGQS